MNKYDFTLRCGLPTEPGETEEIGSNEIKAITETLYIHETIRHKPTVTAIRKAIKIYQDPKSFIIKWRTREGYVQTAYFPLDRVTRIRCGKKTIYEKEAKE